MENIIGFVMLGWMVLAGCWVIYLGLTSIARHLNRQNELKEAELRFQGVNIDSPKVDECKA